MAELSQRKWYSGMLTQEDWWAVWLGLSFFALGLLTIFGYDLVGWIAYPKKWVFNLPEGAVGKTIPSIATWPKTSTRGLGRWEAYWKPI